ncbi:MAG TPA: hypothetical protein VK113_06235 [Gemmatimonadales bacterium]|nr:hypothetical protein [Gemmatimonadales bacterium]
MRFLRCVHAEFLLVSPRLTRTRLGISLVALGTTLVWLSVHALDALTVTLQAGALGAILGAAAIVGNEGDRAALPTALTHPTTPLAVATGRWLAIVLPASVLTIACTVALGWHTGVALVGIIAAAAVGSCAMAVVLPLGSSAALVLFMFMAVAGTVAPERLVDLARPGVLRLAVASAMELGPALRHYRDIATGDLGAVLHAGAWNGLGILVAAAFIARRHR